jgi:ATP synthase protein I
MTDPEVPKRGSQPEPTLVEIADKQAKRKLRARSQKKRSAWFGLGMFGLVGWAIATPTLIGIALGVCIDSHTGTQRSWTLALLIAGLCLGCLNAWIWVSKESRDDD